jgi:FtsH-binding integral membrane protein
VGMALLVPTAVAFAFAVRWALLAFARMHIPPYPIWFLAYLAFTVASVFQMGKLSDPSGRGIVYVICSINLHLATLLVIPTGITLWIEALGYHLSDTGFRNVFVFCLLLGWGGLLLVYYLGGRRKGRARRATKHN